MISTRETAPDDRIIRTAGGRRPVGGGSYRGLPREEVSERTGITRVTRRSRPPLLHAVCDDAALLRLDGGPQVMAEQLRHLIVMAELPNITLQPVPFQASGYPAEPGPFTVMELFGSTAAHAADAANGDRVFTHEADVAGYTDLFLHLQRMALPPAASLQRIAAPPRLTRARRHERPPPRRGSATTTSTTPHTSKAIDMEPQTTRNRLDELAAALRTRGLRVRMGKSALAASPPARRPPQYLLLEEHEDHTRHWYRAWTGPGRDALLKTEYVCPAHDIARAADAVARLVGG